jgi:Tfp pilus assembly protein PilN
MKNPESSVNITTQLILAIAVVCLGIGAMITGHRLSEQQVRVQELSERISKISQELHARTKLATMIDDMDQLEQQAIERQRKRTPAE